MDEIAVVVLRVGIYQAGDLRQAIVLHDATAARNVDETKILDEKSKDSRPGYCRQIRKASLLGLIAGNYKDYSIDLIEDVPPAYTAS
ncbi:uncharacterized protein N7469_011404 [Penicillium citrinum]|uniref:Uncharacterized protein n=2 Tax=Penicillium TaxID=5073 RepID=A0A9W9NF87_PENCI|nr:uncharacterized protein N7469_011404 [Penicillium citrinum]KAJ5217779.1 hypothetical protein N7469_011404 [Penicillium citrinum]KAJ5575339.1 hypothetical protein N7450_009238 [Penicillium hetheringtonii]